MTHKDQQHALPMMVFDKKRINALMRLVLARLRPHKIGVVDIVAALAKNGFPMSRAQFDDCMTTRPERDTTLSVPAFQAFVRVIFRYDASILSAEELLDFVNVMRVPVSLVGYFRSFVSRHAWNSALTTYGLSMQHWDEAVIGRERVVELLLRNVRHRSSCIITGAIGIGKTAVAVEVMRRLALERGAPTYFLDARTIRSLTEFHDALCETLQLLSIENQVSAVRVKQYLQNHYAYIVIDNVRDSEHLTVHHLVRYLSVELPQLICVCTTSASVHDIDYAPFVVFQLSELPWDTDDSAAAILVQRTAVEFGAPPVSNTLVRAIRGQTKGNPLHIRFATLNLLQSVAPQPTFEMQNLGADALPLLGHTARAVLEVLLCLDIDVPIHLLKAMSTQLIDQTAYELTVTLRVLQSGGFVILLHGMTDVVTVQHTVRGALSETVSAVRRADIMERLARALSESHDPHDTLTPTQREYLDLQIDLPTILALTQLLINGGDAVRAAGVITRWSISIVRHGHIAKAIAVVESCLWQLPEEHMSFSVLQRILGELFGNNGQFPRAHVHFKAALHSAMLRADDIAIAQTRVTQVGSTYNFIQRSGDQQYQKSLHHLEKAEQQFSHPTSAEWHGRVLMYRADVLNFGGEQTDALRTINESLSVFERAHVPEWYVDALRVRGAIYLTIGDYIGARQDLLRALAHYEESNQIIHRLQCHARLAMLCFVLGDVPGALMHLERGIQFIHITGGYKYMPMMFDIFSGILRAYGDVPNADTLRARTNVLREEWNLFRSAGVDQLIDLYFLHQIPLAAHRFAASVFAASHTVHDLSTVVMHCIRVLREDVPTQKTRV